MNSAFGLHWLFLGMFLGLCWSSPITGGSRRCNRSWWQMEAKLQSLVCTKRKRGYCSISGWSRNLHSMRWAVGHHRQYHSCLEGVGKSKYPQLRRNKTVKNYSKCIIHLLCLSIFFAPVNSLAQNNHASRTAIRDAAFHTAATHSKNHSAVSKKAKKKIRSSAKRKRSSAVDHANEPKDKAK